MKEPNWENWIHLYCYKLGSTVPFRNINKILSQLDVEEVADWLQEQGYEICKSSEPEPPYTGPPNSNKESKREFDGVDRRLLENGMMWGAFRQLLEYKVGVIRIGIEDNDKYRQALETEPEDRLVEAVEYVKNLEKPVPIRFILERVHDYVDQWDYHQKRKKPSEADSNLKEAIDWMGAAIRGHKHEDIAFGLVELSELTGKDVEEIYARYVPDGDDNYKTLEEYQQLYEEAQNEG